MAFIRIKDGKYRQLVESYRDPATGKPRQRYIRTLGRVSDFDERQDRAFDSAMRQAEQSYPEQFQPGFEKEKAAEFSQSDFLAESPSATTDATTDPAREADDSAQEGEP